jgi:spore maturation protein CgeB
MKIVIYGECEEFGSGAWCYYDTLIKMGHEVKYFSPNNYLEKYKKLIFRIQKKITNSVLPLMRKKHVEKFVEFVEQLKPEIVIVLKGLLLDNLTIKKIKSINSWIVLINHDDFFSKFKNSRSNLQFNAIKDYNYIFPTKEINVRELVHLNSNIEFFPFSYHPEIHTPPLYDINDHNKWKSDIIFIGTRYPERHKQLEYISNYFGDKFNLKIYGQGWDKISKKHTISKFIQGRSLNPEEMAKAIFYSKISLGFLCKENRDDYTQRTFEIPACKGLLLGERTNRHLNFYQEGVEADFFETNNPHELISKIQIIIENEKYQYSLKESGYLKLKNSNNTYKDRMERVLELYKKFRN